MASASPFCLNASSGYLSLAAASAGAKPNGILPSPPSATRPAPCRSRRRDNPFSIGFIQKSPVSARTSKGLQEIHDCVDFFFGQNPVSSERRHHGQRIAPGFVGKYGDEFVAVGILALDVGQFRTNGAGILAALDGMAGQAVALAAIEGELLALGSSRLGVGRTREGSTGQQRQNRRGFPQEGSNQRRFPGVMSMIPMGI